MNPGEFEARIMAAAPRYYRIAKAILRCDADCEDAMQEAMIKAWTNLRKLKDPNYFETWMCRILINECNTLLRRSKRRATVALSDAIPQPEPPDPMLWEALQRIGIQHRVPLVLHHANGYSLAEAARILNLPVSTVKWRIHRGKQMLSALLQKEWEYNESV